MKVGVSVCTSRLGPEVEVGPQPEPEGGAEQGPAEMRPVVSGSAALRG